MKKDAYFFTHDSNARRDPKIIALRGAYGSEGYAWFWMIVEILREQNGYKYNIGSKFGISSLASELQCDVNRLREFINDCINEFNLFESDGQYFWSNSLAERMDTWENIKEKRSKAGKKGANKRWEDNGNATNSDGNAMENDSKAIPESEKMPLPLKTIANASNSRALPSNSIARDNRKEIIEIIEKKVEVVNACEPEEEKHQQPRPDLPQADKILKINWNRLPRNNAEREGFQNLIEQYGYEEVDKALKKATHDSKEGNNLEFLGYVDKIMKTGGVNDFRAYSKKELQETGKKFELYVAVSIPERSTFEPFYVSKEDQKRFNLLLWTSRSKNEPKAETCPICKGEKGFLKEVVKDGRTYEAWVDCECQRRKAV
ncbi:MAG TPA: DUF4373 domain-containing protein [Ignavibacteriales bacterium]|nr:DUF4373 domain-containing protein [Ignavibacteriales bacterium]